MISNDSTVGGFSSIKKSLLPGLVRDILAKDRFPFAQGRCLKREF